VIGRTGETPVQADDRQDAGPTAEKTVARRFIAGKANRQYFSFYTGDKSPAYYHLFLRDTGKDDALAPPSGV